MRLILAHQYIHLKGWTALIAGKLLSTIISLSAWRKHLNRHGNAMQIFRLSVYCHSQLLAYYLSKGHFLKGNYSGGCGHNGGAVPCACPESSFTPASKGRHKALPFGGYLNSFLKSIPH